LLASFTVDRTRRSSLQLTKVIVCGVSLIASLVAINELALQEQFRTRIDATGSRRYTLSDQTTTFLSALNEPWRIVVLMDETLSGRSATKQVDEVLRRYEDASEMMSVTRIDPANPSSMDAYEVLLQDLMTIYSDELQGAEETIDNGIKIFQELMTFASSESAWSELVSQLAVTPKEFETLQTLTTSLAMLGRDGTLILDEVSAPILDRHRLKFCIPSLHKGYFTLGHYPPGYFQLGASTIAGSSVHLPAILKNLMTKSPYAEWFSNAKTVKRTGCNMDLRPPVYEPAKGNVICVGDNAAYAEAAIKGAIGFGYTAAHSTLTALEGGDGNAYYNDYWHHAVNYFSPEYRRNTSQIKPLPRVLNDGEADTLFKWTEDNGIWGVPDDCLTSNRQLLHSELPEIAKKIFVSQSGKKDIRAA